jgi:ribonuclease R
MKNDNNSGVDRRRVEELVKNSSFSMDVRGVMQALKLPKKYRGTVKHILKDLSRKGAVNKSRKKFGGEQDKKTVTGKIDIRNDFGFLLQPDGEDIFIGRNSAEDLLPGDTIEVWPKKSRSGGIEGELKQIVKRTEAPVMCRVKMLGPETFAVLPFKMNPMIKIIEPPEKLQEGDLILVKIEGTSPGLTGRVTAHIYDKSDIKMYIDFILARNEIRRVFPDAALADADKMALDTDKIAGRLDLRDRTIFTIDPKDAKDFDDAVSLEKNGDSYRLGVHIADVTHYMKEGAPLDVEAYQRGTSVYLPGAVIPMLPEKLSNELCSLKGGVDRMTFSILMDVDALGNITSYEIKESVISSKKRLTYEEVDDILAGKSEVDAPREVKESIFLMNSLRDILRLKFKEGGSIDFTLGEAVFVYNEEGGIADIVRKGSTDSHKLIEYFMVSANVCAADFIEKNSRKAGIYRVHEKPFMKDIEEFNRYMRGMGLEVKLKTGSNREFQEVLDKVKGTPQSDLIEKKLLRSMKLARYSEKNLGHFGLGLAHYSHFTSPIRRYADVLAHRLIKHFSGVETMKDADRAYLRTAAENISSCEVRAEKAENDTFRLYCLDFLKDKVGEEMEGVVSRVTKNGLVIELKRYPVEGFVNFDVMPGDEYVFDQYSQTAKGRRSKKIIKTGMDFSVIIVRIDLESLKLELEP